MISVVICAKNEPGIGEAITSVRAASHLDEIIVVCADEPTAAIAREAVTEPFVVVTSDRGSLAADRQLGADLATGVWVAFVDADHRISRGDLQVLVEACAVNGWVIAQAGLRTGDRSFWNRAESDFLAMTHNTPGQRDMVGVAPAVFHRDLFRLVRFAESGTGGGDDTDLLYRLSRDTDCKVGIADVVVVTEHAPRLRDYWRKWRWYGAADASFGRTYPERRRSMLFHLLVRYPIQYPVRALRTGHLRAIPYAIAQGLVRASCFIKS